MGVFLVQVQAHFEGLVQGVGFRKTVLKIAKPLNINGIVKNLPDGRVEVMAQGKKEELEAFLAAIQKNPGSAVIEKVTKSYGSVGEKLSGFTIVF